ncbi:hypothetical protein [Pelagimonas varians]|uniref:Uncharacterized protein n=1 Tax=Pelagimonas varians TaxID=696760 RepID=A0A238KTZ4_9RHOB|nr:hypothetical protein [Pelagimonas varians]PYG28258.1 hypothetical protein C8N36_11231 [Pelagimonas varians]SMX46334.1 hypothetical protein PEV8663_03233 [Pelagimonas varians]
MIRAASQFAPMFSLHPLSAMQAWVEQLRHRKAMTTLDEAGLRDSHMNAAPALQEQARVLWDAPDHWTK